MGEIGKKILERKFKREIRHENLIDFSKFHSKAPTYMLTAPFSCSLIIKLISHLFFFCFSSFVARERFKDGVENDVTTQFRQ